MNSEIVELNVGGSIYTTSRTTLASCPDSMLACLVSHGALPTASDSMNRIFIDRDGPLFRHILNFLRDKHLNLPTDFTDYVQLYSEADFYRIEPIMRQLETHFPTLSQQQPVRIPELSPAESWSYVTLVSRFYDGSIISMIGCIRILENVSFLSVNSKKFLAEVLASVKDIERFICEVKFAENEGILIVKYWCEQNGGAKGMDEAIFRIAKKCGITTGYWDDMFYLTLSDKVPHRDLFCSFLRQRHKGRLLSSSIADSQPITKGSAKSPSKLIERWCFKKPC